MTDQTKSLEQLLGSDRLQFVPYSYVEHRFYGEWKDTITGYVYCGSGRKKVAEKLLQEINIVKSGGYTLGFLHRFKLLFVDDFYGPIYEDQQRGLLCLDSEAREIFYGNNPEHKHISLMVNS